jgi:hypothetical protein
VFDFESVGGGAVVGGEDVVVVINSDSHFWLTISAQRSNKIRET